MRRRVEACAPDDDGNYGWWWVDGCGHLSPERDFPSWQQAIEHALNCNR